MNSPTHAHRARDADSSAIIDVNRAPVQATEHFHSESQAALRDRGTIEGKGLFAVERIEPGEKIWEVDATATIISLERYLSEPPATEPFYSQIGICGSSECPGVVRNTDFLLPAVQCRHAGYIPTWVQEVIDRTGADTASTGV